MKKRFCARRQATPLGSQREYGSREQSFRGGNSENAAAVLEGLKKTQDLWGVKLRAVKLQYFFNRPGNHGNYLFLRLNSMAMLYSACGDSPSPRAIDASRSSSAASPRATRTRLSGCFARGFPESVSDGESDCRAFSRGGCGT